MTTGTKPFHEAVVEQMRGAGHAELGLLGPLLERTTLPAEHCEAVAVAWDARREELGWNETGDSVSAHIRARGRQMLKEKLSVQLALAGLENLPRTFVAHLIDFRMQGQCGSVNYSAVDFIPALSKALAAIEPE